MKELLLRTPDVDLNYFEGPQNGLPLLLLHGSADRWQHFMPIIPELINYLQVYSSRLGFWEFFARVARD